MIKRILFTILAVAVFNLVGSAQVQYCNEEGSIHSVRNTRIGANEYVIFNVIGTANGAPEFEVNTKSPPFTDYSGDEEIDVSGSRFKNIVLRGIVWTCQTRHSSTSRRIIKDVKELWTFEGIAEYAVGHSGRYVSTYSYPAGRYTKVVMKFRR